ncbi:MAG: dihydroxyacid dehydratase/phosphogluconate dehydratase [Rhodoferax sp.]|jgi:dihydroxyacid dehydratase/phosphogluconate dehydratase
MGCSTNTIIHLIAISRRAGEHCAVGLDDFDATRRKVPVIAKIWPSGDTYLIGGFYYAGGMLGMMSVRQDYLELDVIRPLSNPIYTEGALAMLCGNLAPNGCVIKPRACAPQYFYHTGSTLVFDDYPSLKAATKDENLDVTANHSLVLHHAGP